MNGVRSDAHRHGTNPRVAHPGRCNKFIEPAIFNWNVPRLTSTGHSPLTIVGKGPQRVAARLQKAAPSGLRLENHLL